MIYYAYLSVTKLNNVIMKTTKNFSNPVTTFALPVYLLEQVAPADLPPQYNKVKSRYSLAILSTKK